MTGIPNLRKAAVLLTSIPEDVAAQILGKLSPKQVEAVSIEIARLGPLASDEQQEVFDDFFRANPNSLGGGAGGLELAMKLVEQALGKQARETLENLEHSFRRIPFSFLKKVDPQNLLSFIIDEHPQTIALILSYLAPSYGAEVIAGLPADRQLAVIRRVAHMGQTSPEVIEEVERGLETRMASVMSQSLSDNAGGVDSVAQILNVTGRAVERSLLENLAQEDPDLVEEIRRRMFVFEDILKVSDKDMQTVLKNVDNSQWAMALKGQDETLKDKVLGNLSQRAGDMLREEMDYLGPVRSSEVEKAQQQVVDTIRRLEDSNLITLASDDQEEEFIT